VSGQHENSETEQTCCGISRGENHVDYLISQQDGVIRLLSQFFKENVGLYSIWIPRMFPLLCRKVGILSSELKGLIHEFLSVRVHNPARLAKLGIIVGEHEIT
jgi:hypothetical protein